MPPLFIVSSASHSGSSGARTGACGGTAMTSDARVDPNRRRPSRWSRRRPMMPEDVLVVDDGHRRDAVRALVAVRERVDGEVRPHRRRVGLHRLAHRDAAQQPLEREPPVERPGAGREQPAERDDQQALRREVGERHRDPDADDREAEQPADPRGHRAGAVAVLRARPGERPDDPAAVERHPGQQADAGEDDVQRRRARRGSRPAPRAPGATTASSTPSASSDPAQRERQQRPRERDRELVARRRRLDAERREPADEAEDDRRRLDAVPPADERVRQLVGDDRHEEPDGDRHADEPLDRRREAGRRERRLLRAEQRDDRDEDRPRERDPDLDPEQPRDREAVAAHQAGTSAGDRDRRGLRLVRRMGPGPPAAVPPQQQRQRRRSRPRPRSSSRPRTAAGTAGRASPSRRRTSTTRAGRTARGTARTPGRTAGRRRSRRRPSPPRSRARSSTGGATAPCRARSLRENANEPAISSADPAATRKKRWNTTATSTMCCRSRASSTGHAVQRDVERRPGR